MGREKIKIFDAKSLGENVKKYRNEKALTQKGLAQIVSMPQSTIAKLEKGNLDNFTIDKLDKVANALDITLDDLLNESVEKYTKISGSNAKYRQKLKDSIHILNENQISEFNKFIKEFIIYKQQE